ncbi:ATP phosphoribosyltransferase [Chitinispirillales bacterium ANBcel5]|uniref:ATP phosphoribosyltransferase n=1 Tax=Cellulosispirillum alkaliphilum TaxID=3039283 RepID=UPI002A50C71E|nr:ATP phosphoribosyltransferase [Chitinispirillales bacterium ANBcel5]
MIKIALPNKGMLFDPTIDLFRACGYKASKSRKSLSSADPDNGVEFFFLRPDDIPMYVGKGIIDAGVTGIDFEAEAGMLCEKVLDLEFGKSKHYAAVPNDCAIKTLDELRDKRIATSYPEIVRNYFGSPAPEIIPLTGAVEISVSLGVADAVVDVVETGTTLKQAGLRILGEPLFTSQAALFAHPGRAGLGDIVTLKKRLEGKLVAKSWMMIEYDVGDENLKNACSITPGLSSPTISPLYEKGWYAVKAMVKKSDANLIMDKLSDLGCKGILLTDIESARI